MRALFASSIVFALLLVGCSKPAETSSDNTPAPAPPGATSTGGAGNVAPMTPNVGGVSPVAGGENLGGTTGGGAAQTLKDRAKGVANGSAGTPPPNGDEDTGG